MMAYLAMMAPRLVLGSVTPLHVRVDVDHRVYVWARAQDFTMDEGLEDRLLTLQSVAIEIERHDRVRVDRLGREADHLQRETFAVGQATRHVTHHVPQLAPQDPCTQ